MATNPGIFSNSHHIVIQGGQFTAVNHINNSVVVKGGLELMKEHVATSAFHDSAQRVDPPRCHPNTRRAVIDEISQWILQETAVRTSWMLWLNGAAGARKSAIGQSISELCIHMGYPVASFFFSRTDPSRNQMKPLVATLAYQVIQLIPSVSDYILRAIEFNPLIFQQSIHTQFDQLIIRPLRLLECDWKLLLLIDGVDECEELRNQTELVTLCAKLLCTKDLPLIIMFGSRAENQLKMSFNSPTVAGILLQIPLDDNYLPDNDILLFLNDSFAAIKQTHPFSHLLGPDWPPLSSVEDIVEKSSGQFIYASVAMRFISLPRSGPAEQLDIVLGLHPVGSLTPFAQLDTLYKHIFSQVQDLDRTTSVIALCILSKKLIIAHVAQFLDIRISEVYTSLADLTSVILCEPKTENTGPATIRFLHASLPDFLFDPARSSGFYIDSVAWGTRLSTLWLKNAALSKYEDRAYHGFEDFVKVFKHAGATLNVNPDLREAIAQFDPNQISKHFVTRLFPQYLAAVWRLDGGEVYREQLAIIVRHCSNLNGKNPAYQPSYIDAETKHDISKILQDIRQGDTLAKPEGHETILNIAEDVTKPETKGKNAEKSVGNSAWHSKIVHYAKNILPK